MTRQLELKYAHADIKAFDQATGTVEAIVSVFGNVDFGGDRVMPGAFKQTLDEWSAKGDPIPVIWSHEWDDPMSHIGAVVDAKEVETGLYTKMQLDVEANPKAAYVARLLKQRRVTQFSFGYYTRESNFAKDEKGNTIREITNIELFEVGPTLLGMNPATQLLEAASRTIDDLKAGRVLSGKNEEALAQARDLIDGVLAQIASDASIDPASGKSIDVEVKVAAPQWMSDNAKQGLDWYDQGLAGDGVVDATIREARAIADGNVSDEKARKMAAWFARHMVDLDAPAADPGNDGFPSPGVVAHALWGGGTKTESERALAWAERRVEQLDYGKSIDAESKDAETDPEDGDTDSRDTATNIINNNPELGVLLTRPKHTEDNP